MTLQIGTRIVSRTLSEVRRGIEAAIPRLVTGLLFAVVAYAAIRLLLTVVGRVLGAYYSDRQALVVQLGVTIVGVFLWFGAALAFLKIVGFGDIAASLGTAVGFVALGVSYALSEMVEDTVAGVYLLRDPDFEAGDRVVVGKTEGVDRDRVAQEPLRVGQRGHRRLGQPRRRIRVDEAGRRGVTRRSPRDGRSGRGLTVRRRCRPGRDPTGRADARGSVQRRRTGARGE